MRAKTYPSDVTREQFERVRPLLEGARKQTRPREVDLYEVFCTVLYLLRTGCHLVGRVIDPAPSATLLSWVNDPAYNIGRRCLLVTMHKRCAKAAPYEHGDGTKVGSLRSQMSYTRDKSRV